MGDLLDLLISGVQNGLIWSMLILGVYISFRVLDIADLSIEGTFPLGATIAALLIFKGVPPILATILSVIGGFGGGVLTGILHTKLKIPAILAGIITMTGLLTVNLVILGLASDSTLSLGSLRIENTNTVYALPSKWFESLLTNVFHVTKNFRYWASLLSVIVVSGLFCVACYGIIYFLFGTEFGMALRATGNNQTMARAQGINTTMMIIIGLGISNALIALSGALFAQNAGNANVESGKGAIVIGLSAIIIGELIFGRKTFKLSLVSIGVGSFIFFCIKYVAIILNVDFFLNLVLAALITIIMAAPMFKKNRRKKSC